MKRPLGLPTDSIPVNPYTIGKNTLPFSEWDFENIWKWDDVTNRPLLRKVGM